MIACKVTFHFTPFCCLLFTAPVYYPQAANKHYGANVKKQAMCVCYRLTPVLCVISLSF